MITLPTETEQWQVKWLQFDETYGSWSLRWSVFPTEEAATIFALSKKTEKHVANVSVSLKKEDTK